MKRVHIGLEVKDLDGSIKFYSALFGARPTHRETDYAKWMLEDPRVNFAIQCLGDEPAGSVHFGVQVENRDELADCTDWLAKAGEHEATETDAECCYYKSDKVWSRDPDGFRWETFLTHGRITEYGEHRGLPLEAKAETEAK